LVSVRKKRGSNGWYGLCAGARREVCEAYFYLQEVFWGAIDLFEALLTGVWEGLHRAGLAVAVCGVEMGLSVLAWSVQVLGTVMTV